MGVDNTDTFWARMGTNPTDFDSGDSLLIDTIAIGTAYASVVAVPVPSTYALLGFGRGRVVYPVAVVGSDRSVFSRSEALLWILSRPGSSSNELVTKKIRADTADRGVGIKTSGGLVSYRFIRLNLKERERGRLAPVRNLSGAGRSRSKKKCGLLARTSQIETTSEILRKSPAAAHHR
jgi:hypothetical protein